MLNNKIRIAKAIANLGYCSRREAEELILQGKVKVNNKIIDTPVFFINDRDKISINNKILESQAQEVKVYGYYKPKGYICSRTDEKNRETIYDDLPNDLPRVVYIGRLDLNSEGLLLLTNNGKLSHCLTSASLGLKRTYRVRAFGEVSQKKLDDLALGIKIEGIRYKPIVASIINNRAKNIWLEFILTEGKNKEIRKICEHLGLQVNRLIRTHFGNISLDDLQGDRLVELDINKIKKMLNKDQIKDIF